MVGRKMPLRVNEVVVKFGRVVSEKHEINDQICIIEVIYISDWDLVSRR